MWVQSDGQLGEDIYQVTTITSSHLLVIGENAAIIDTGIAATAEELIHKINEVLPDDCRLSQVFLCHDEFDHVGGIASLRKAYPGLQVMASTGVAAKLADPDFLRTSYAEQSKHAAALQQEMTIPIEEWCSLTSVDHTIKPGDHFHLGYDVEIRVIDASGYRSNQLGYYVMPDKCIVAAEAVGSYHGRDKSVPSFSDNFNDYMNTLDRIAQLDLSVVALPHAGAITGELAQKFIDQIREAATALRTNLKDRINSGEIIDNILPALIAEWDLNSLSPDGPFAGLRRKTAEGMIRQAASD
ncbi:MAG: MBL fold metallo-hydrolase [bacterium]|nr:MBL fold metallo-hydrolase [bacterium]